MNDERVVPRKRSSRATGNANPADSSGAIPNGALGMAKEPDLVKNLKRLALAALLLAVAPSAFAADAPKVVGTWDAAISSPNGELSAVIVVKETGGALEAEVEVDGVQRAVTDEKLEGDVFRMKVQYEGGVYDVEAKIAGDTMEGTWQGGGYSGTLKAKRRQ
jgi:hypothetical protein